MKISVIIPTYTLTDELENLAIDCARSLRDADEIIICEDGGRFSEKLRMVCDTYIYNYKNAGFTKNVNRAWRFATGDFVMIVNSDVEKISGDLKDLCVPGKITSPACEDGAEMPGMAGFFFVVPDEIKRQRGLLREELKTFCSDTEYEMRTKDIFEKVPSVRIDHAWHKTLDASKIDYKKELKRDRKIYEKFT